MTAPSCPTNTRIYSKGNLVAEGFGADEVTAMLAEHADGVLWLDLFDPDIGDLESVAAQFHLHPLAIEDAVLDHERPKLDRYQSHLFLNVYAVEISGEGEASRFRKMEISAFVTERALITVRKSAGDTSRLTQRWDADAKLFAGSGVGFLLYGLLDVVVDGQVAAVKHIDTAMDTVEDTLLEEGGAPRAVRMHGIALRKAVAALRRAVAPMPDLVNRATHNDLHLVDENLLPYYRDVEDHAAHAADEVEHLRDRIGGLLQSDLNEQSNVLNEITRKLAAWAAIIAVPTVLTGYFGMNVPYWGYGRFWGFLLSLALIVLSASSLYLYLKKRSWL